MSSSSSTSSLREQVLRLAREIEALSETDIPKSEFFAGFSRRLAQAVGARGVAIYLADGAPLRLEQEIGLEELGFLGDPAIASRNGVILGEALQTGETRSYAPDSPGTPTRHLYIAATISRRTQPVGVVEVMLRPETPEMARRGLMQYVEQMAGYASRYLGRESGDGGIPLGAEEPEMTAEAVDLSAQREGSNLPVAFWVALEQFLLQLERSRNVQEVAATAASDGRLLFGIDRVSLVRRRGRKTVVEAISGQDRVNKRANLVRRMASLARVVMAGRESLHYAGNVGGLAPQLEQPLADYVAESHSRMLVIVPLFEPKALVRPEFEDREQGASRENREARVIGCLVLERINDSRVPPKLPEKIDLVVDHVAAALARAVAVDQIFLRRTLQGIGRTRDWFHGRGLAKSLAITALVLGIAAALWGVRWPYKVVCEGRLMPETQRHVFAPGDGQIVELRVRGGEQVKEGDVLAVLTNDELRGEIVQLASELAVREQTVISLGRQVAESRRGGRREEESKLDAERLAAEAEVTGLKRQLEILRERESRLQVRAPISGTVATFQLDQLLRDRPVRRGEVLLEVMDDQGAWHLELDVEDFRMGHVNRAIARNEGDVRLPVEFVLALAPEERFLGRLKKLESRAEAKAEVGTVVPVEVGIEDVDRLPTRRIGAEVRAKIETGDRALGYVLFGDVIDFVYKYLWL